MTAMLIRVPVTLKLYLEKAAAAENRSMSSHVWLRLEASVAQEGQRQQRDWFPGKVNP